MINPLTQQEFARLIAKQRGIKYKSAMRYLQRARAPEGKQRIVHPTFPGLKPAVRQQVAAFVEAERKRITPQTWYDEYLHSLTKLGEDVKAGRLVIQKGTLPEGSLLDKIAVLINDLQYEQAGEALDVDLDLIEHAIKGGVLNRLQQEELRGAYSDVYRDRELQREYDIDIQYVEDQAAIITDAIRQKDIDNQNTIREGVADGEIDLEKFTRNKGGTRILRQLNNTQLGRILDAFANQKRGVPNIKYVDGEAVPVRHFDINEMLDAAELDGYDITSEVEDSQFWAWFRELFY